MSLSPIAEDQTPSPAIPQEGDACLNCGSQEPWGASSWCPACGYYPALGGTSLKSAEEVEADGKANGPAWETLHEGPSNLWEATPPWAWTALGGVILILFANLGLRFLVAKASDRTLLTLGECSLGFLVASLAHGSAYLFAACLTDKFGPFDFFMKPIELWKPTFHQLPEGARRVWFMAWGTTAIFAALFIVSGFAFESLFDDWGFETPERTNVPQEFVKKEKAEVQLLETRCVIIGYTLSEKGELSTLILASAPRGRMAYVGVLSQPDLPEENRAEVLKELQSLPNRGACYLQQGVPLKQAIWVEPQLLCLVEHQSWTSRYSLEKPSFLKLVSAEDDVKEAEKAKKKKALKPEKKAR